ncbi:MAG: outer membrane beta-barrel protein [Hyphomonas sp.]
MTQLKRMSLVSVAVCGLMASTAVAQDGDFYSRDKYEAVMDRSQPKFDPEPVRLGAFLVDSSLQAGVTATDNALASSTNEESDIVVRVGGAASMRTNWAVHEIAADVSAFRNEYMDLSDESSNDLRARLRGRLDATREVSLNGSVFAEDRAEPRTALSDSIGLDRPVEFTRVGFTVGANYINDRVRWENEAGWSESNYKDGKRVGTNINVDQDFRDRSEMMARTRLSYAVTPDLAVYGQATGRDLQYDQAQLLGGDLRKRDSQGYTVAAGIDFELTSLVRGDVNVGFMNENKDDPFFEDVDGLSVDGRMQWFPTRLTTVGFNASRRVVDVGVVQSPSAVQTSLGARVDHELRRNIVLSAYGNLQDYDFEEIDRTDEVVDLGVSATYKMNKRVHFETFARHMERDGSGVDSLAFDTFEVNQLGVGIKIYP